MFVRRLAVSILLTVALAAIPTAPAAGFENLDFEGTLLDINSLGTVYSNPDVFEPAIVTPGWSFRAEYPDGSPVLPHCNFPGGIDCGPGYPVHGAMIDGHIGVSAQVVLTVRGRENVVSYSPSPTLGETHSLWLYGHIGPSGPSGPPIPVAYQTGMIPSEARSIRMMVDRAHTSTEDERADHFSVRFNGYEVEMYPVSPVFEESFDYLSGCFIPGSCTGQNMHDLDDLIVYAGNIESIAGLTREMAVRPESYLVEYNSTGGPVSFNSTPSLIFDNISFSNLAAPGPTVQVPEPHALLLALLTGSLLVLQRVAASLYCKLRQR